MEWTISVCTGQTGIFGTGFEDGPFWLVWSFWSVGLKCPFSISQNCCSQNRSFVSCLQEQWANMQWLGSGLCNWNVHNCTVPLGTWNFRNFKPEFLLNGKHPEFSLKNPIRIDHLCIDWKQKSLMGTKRLYQSSGKEKRKLFVVLCPCPPQNVKFGIFTS